ncbi:MAG TPA: hypothetical protein VFA90_09515 [Terriglobales bacterium]|nr:hypothetical protein [Terriglobales bacterium]
MIYIFLAFSASILLFLWLKEKSLYVIFPWAYVQNFVLAWMYTSGWVSRGSCQGLLIIKEFLLLWLFFHFLPKMRVCGGGKWLFPLKILAVFTGWCFLRYFGAVLLQGQSALANLWTLRVFSFPLQILVVAVGVAFAKPTFAKRFVRHMAYFVSIVALAGIVVYLLPDLNFWRDHVNVAQYNADVKGESGDNSVLQQQLSGEDSQEAEEGLPGNARGRDEFAFISPFRAIGTVCDAVGFGHLVAFPLLLLAFCAPSGWKHQILAGMTAIALFLTFTRSAWIFVAISVVFVLLRCRRYKLVFGSLALIILGLAVWTPMSELYSDSLAFLSWTNPQEGHTQGLVWLYKEGLWNWRNVLGQGLDAEVYEGGYGIILIRFGFPALISSLMFFFAIYRALQNNSYSGTPVFLVAQAAPLAMVVTMNTSYYPFSFISYLLPWFVIGTCLALVAREKYLKYGESHELAANN